MKKKIFTFLFAIVTGMVTINAQQLINGIYYYLDSDSQTAGVEGADMTELSTGDIVIPASIVYDNMTYSVEYIGQNAFYGCSSLTSVTIPNSVTRIETFAFRNCTNLATVKIPEGVTSIGYHAFSGCSNLTSVSIPSSVISMSNSFYECNNLTSVTLNTIKYIFSYGVSSEFGEQVQEYILGDSITFLNGEIFMYCKHHSLKIGKNVSQIDYSSMPRAYLTNIEIAEGNETFDSRNNCNAIIKTASNTLEFGCKGTIIPEGVTTIGEDAFGGVNLNTIIIPESVTRIEDYAFSYGSIRHISIPNYMMTISCAAFLNSSIDSITWNAKHATMSGYNYLKETRLSTLIVGENVEFLPDFFFECDNLMSVVWRAKNFNGFEGEMNIKRLSHSVKKIIFGDKVEVIPEKLCYWTQIDSVVIPNSVKTIKAGAFYSCEYLKTVVLGDGITTLEYVDNGFDDYGVFTASNNITSFTCYATTPPTMKEHIQSNIVYVPATSVNAYKSANYWKKHTILPIGATPVETDEIHVTPSENYADIVWKAIANAASYELYIEFMGNTWRFVFDAEGILTSMANHAPARYDAPQGTQSAGFSYTVMGLTSGTTYNVTITAKAANGSTLNTETTTFTTTGEPQGIEDVNANNMHSKKILRDGNVYILRGDKVFTLQGQEVK